MFSPASVGDCRVREEMLKTHGTESSKAILRGLGISQGPTTKLLWDLEVMKARGGCSNGATYDRKGI